MSMRKRAKPDNGLQTDLETIEDIKNLSNNGDSIGDVFYTPIDFNVNTRDQTVLFLDGEILAAEAETTHSQLINKIQEEKNEEIRKTEDFQKALSQAYEDFHKTYVDSGLNDLWELQFSHLSPDEWLDKYPTVARPFVETYSDALKENMNEEYWRPTNKELSEKLGTDEYGIGHILNDCLFIDTYSSSCNLNSFIDKAKEDLNVNKVYLCYDDEDSKDLLLERAAKKK